jgi:hypothetical protein
VGPGDANLFHERRLAIVGLDLFLGASHY